MKKHVKSIVLIIISIILFVIGFILIKKSLNNYTQDVLSYVEKSSIDYKVYLKENSFFDEEYLTKGKAYITSLIDYIDVNIDYSMSFDSKRSGTYVYYINGIMSANVSNSENNYWQKTYSLVPNTVVEYTDSSNLEIIRNIKIDYQTYNEMLLKFKEEYKLAFDGNFKVVLYIENIIDSLDGSKFKNSASTDLQIPLTKATIEVPITVNEISNNNKFYGKYVEADSNLDIIYRVISGVLFLIAIILIIKVVLRYVKQLEKISAYTKKVKNILKTYDGIIVNVNSLSLKDLTIVDVKKFNELLDAHEGIGLPINFYEEKNRAVFVLINGNMVYRYIIENGELNNEK